MSDVRQIDPRGPRFVASVTTVLLAVALLVAPSPPTVVLLAVQTLAFGLGAGYGVQRTPYAWVFKTFVRPRLAAPTQLEDPAPPRFAQGVGLAFGVVALTGYLTGATLLGAIATGFALGAAFLNAVFGFCLGCELYPLARRLVPSRRAGAAPRTVHDKNRAGHSPVGAER
jgi:hypothetical protein